jgi:hypothetical protein
VIWPDQVDGDGGFAYVGRLFHGRKYSSRPKRGPRQVTFCGLRTSSLALAAAGQKNTRMSGPNELFGFEVDIPVSLVVVMRDSRYKMPCPMGVFCRSGPKQVASDRQNREIFPYEQRNHS